MTLLMSDLEICKLAGWSKNWFCDNRRVLEGEGFPKRDKLLGNKTLRADVEAWFEKRRRVSDADPSRVTMTGLETIGECYDKF